MNITFDTTELEKQVKEEFNYLFMTKLRRDAAKAISGYFEGEVLYVNNKLALSKPQSAVLLESFLSEALSPERLRRTMQKCLDDNYERIVSEAMDKAMRHHANKMAFEHFRNLARKDRA